jgi:hypothetical protein
VERVEGGEGGGADISWGSAATVLGDGAGEERGCGGYGLVCCAC